MSLHNNLAAKFIQRLDSLISHHDELIIAIHNKKNEATLKTELTIQFVVQSVLLWETFLNDLILAYIEMEPSRALASIENDVKQIVNTKYGERIKRAIKISLPRNPKRDTIIKLLDPKGWNITSNDADKLYATATKYISSKFAKNFAFDTDDSEFYNYLVALRNFLSHNSTGSKSKLKNSIASISTPKNSFLKAKSFHAKNYLKEITSSERSRALMLVNRIKEIAIKL